VPVSGEERDIVEKKGLWERYKWWILLASCIWLAGGILMAAAGIRL
jgi:hypothetical protein